MNRINYIKPYLKATEFIELISQISNETSYWKIQGESKSSFFSTTARHYGFEKIEKIMEDNTISAISKVKKLTELGKKLVEQEPHKSSKLCLFFKAIADKDLDELNKIYNMITQPTELEVALIQSQSKPAL